MYSSFNLYYNIDTPLVVIGYGTINVASQHQVIDQIYNFFKTLKNY